AAPDLGPGRIRASPLESGEVPSLSHSTRPATSPLTLSRAASVEIDHHLLTRICARVRARTSGHAASTSAWPQSCTQAGVAVAAHTPTLKAALHSRGPTQGPRRRGAAAIDADI